MPTTAKGQEACFPCRREDTALIRRPVCGCHTAPGRRTRATGRARDPWARGGRGQAGRADGTRRVLLGLLWTALAHLSVGRTGGLTDTNSCGASLTNYLYLNEQSTSPWLPEQSLAQVPVRGFHCPRVRSPWTALCVGAQASGPGWTWRVTVWVPRVGKHTLGI